MMRWLDDITSMADSYSKEWYQNGYFLGGAVILFLAYRSIRKWLTQKVWFRTKIWIASLIAGIVSLFVITNIVVIIQTIFYHNR